MAKFRVNGTTVIDVYVTVEADSLEEAMEKVEDMGFYTEEYCNEAVGVASSEDDYEELEICSTDDITFNEEYSEEV